MLFHTFFNSQGMVPTMARAVQRVVKQAKITMAANGHNEHHTPVARLTNSIIYIYWSFLYRNTRMLRTAVTYALLACSHGVTKREAITNRWADNKLKFCPNAQWNTWHRIMLGIYKHPISCSVNCAHGNIMQIFSHICYFVINHNFLSAIKDSCRSYQNIHIYTSGNDFGITLVEEHF